MEELLKKLILLRKNPELAAIVPQGEMLKMMEALFKAFQELKTGIETNKIRGQDGVTPVAGKDYLSKSQTEKMVETEIDKLAKKAEALEKQVSKRLQAIRDGKDGKNAEVTQAQVEKAAELASKLIELPDFRVLITQEPEAIRDSLELLQGEERLDASAIKNLDQYATKQVTGGGWGVVRRLSNLDDVNVQSTRPNENATIQYQTASGKWLTGVAITVSATEPTDPKFGDLWIVLP